MADPGHRYRPLRRRRGCLFAWTGGHAIPEDTTGPRRTMGPRSLWAWSAPCRSWAGVRPGLLPAFSLRPGRPRLRILALPAGRPASERLRGCPEVPVAGCRWKAPCGRVVGAARSAAIDSVSGPVGPETGCVGGAVRGRRPASGRDRGWRAGRASGRCRRRDPGVAGRGVAGPPGTHDGGPGSGAAARWRGIRVGAGALADVGRAGDDRVGGPGDGRGGGRRAAGGYAGRLAGAGSARPGRARRAGRQRAAGLPAGHRPGTGHPGPHPPGGARVGPADGVRGGVLRGLAGCGRAGRRVPAQRRHPDPVAAGAAGLLQPRCGRHSREAGLRGVVRRPPAAGDPGSGDPRPDPARGPHPLDGAQHHRPGVAGRVRGHRLVRHHHRDPGPRPTR